MHFLTILSVGGLIDGIGDTIIAALISGAGGIITAYVFIREKLLKNETKNDQIVTYVDGKLQLFDNKILELQRDISDFKEINKETARSLTENTAAIRELKLVLNMLREQLNKDRKQGRSNLLLDEDD